ncbi:MAG: 4Fe-4S dicluster domain-containing protein [Calditrichaceae bacterium]|nr:4Fe-4S dicluster domain-containing protein [Calditrichaceae bacterium]
MGKKILDKPFVKVEPELCKGCGLCIDACPTEVLKFHTKFNSKGYHYAFYLGDNCTGCGVCFYACPEPEAIVVYKKGYEYTGEEVA